MCPVKTISGKDGAASFAAVSSDGGFHECDLVRSILCAEGPSGSMNCALQDPRGLFKSDLVAVSCTSGLS